MAASLASGVRIAGVASAVPSNLRTILEDAADAMGAEAEKISQSTGVRQRHVAPNGTCTSDLCLAATERLLDELGWSRDSVELLVFVSQTPDYVLPATSCSLHSRLGLSKSCAAFDINLGCSGYVYGLWVASRLLGSAGGSRALLLVGDTITPLVSPQDQSVATLFGDAGSATALEGCSNGSEMHFRLGTDGAGQGHLMVPAGGFRHPRSENTAVRKARKDGNVRSDEDLFMNGAEVFAFTLRTVPPLFSEVLEQAAWTVAEVDAFVMHQANRFMIQHLAKRMRLPSEKVVIALEDFGNTSSASIPLALTVSLAERLRSSEMKLVLAGFGVGFSWAAAALRCGNLCVPDLVRVD
jgi:3-oxoacyl-[acyl-carrier-protein] synthase-3